VQHALLRRSGRPSFGRHRSRGPFLRVASRRERRHWTDGIHARRSCSSGARNQGLPLERGSRPVPPAGLHYLTSSTFDIPPSTGALRGGCTSAASVRAGRSSSHSGRDAGRRGEPGADCGDASSARGNGDACSCRGRRAQPAGADGKSGSGTAEWTGTPLARSRPGRGDRRKDGDSRSSQMGLDRGSRRPSSTTTRGASRSGDGDAGEVLLAYGHDTGRPLARSKARLPAAADVVPGWYGEKPR